MWSCKHALLQACHWLRGSTAVPTQPESHSGYSHILQGPLSSHSCVKTIWQLPFPFLRSQDEVQGSPGETEMSPPRASVHLKALEGLGRLETAPVSMGKGA